MAIAVNSNRGLGLRVSNDCAQSYGGGIIPRWEDSHRPSKFYTPPCTRSYGGVCRSMTETAHLLTY